MQLANSYRSKGAALTLVNTNLDSSFHYLEKAGHIYRSLKTKEAILGEAMVFHNYGTVGQIQGDYVQAIDYYIRASKLFDEIGDVKSRPYTLNNLASLYALVDDFPKSEKYARECIELSQKNKDEFMVATGHINLAGALMKQGKYEEAVSSLNEVWAYGEKYNDPYKIFLYHLNYATYLMDYKRDYPSAIKEYEKAQQLATEVGDEWEIMRKNVALSEAYLENKQFAEAEKTAINALNTAIALQAKDKQREALWVLAQANAHNRNFETAFNQLNEAYLLKDTVFADNNQRQMALLETEYETEKKEIRINALEKERVLYGIIFAVSLLGIIILLGALYLRQRAKKQLAQQQVIQLEKEKQLIATHAILEGEATERTRLARDLHDGLGGMLSAVKLNLFDMKKGGALLASEDVMQFNKVVEMLDSSITELRRVAHNMMPDSLSRYGLKVSLQDFCNSLPNVHFHYFGNDERLENTLEIMIYRSVHELVNNALKHAEAENINVQIVQQDDRVSLTVQDDGKGLDPGTPVKGTGLNNIRTRAESVGGTLNVFSEPGKGTEVNVEFKI
ncbi:tetratricopeptide repeat-containing sensor histidine kinase [Petrimonas sp.]|uniref:tetratricopeptide repeat-containing sensor histidine kinase n=1 Tax=Petrimonas sp. TaxID=2023866 RepID=UPI003F512B18